MVTISFEYFGTGRLALGKVLEFLGVHVTFRQQDIHVFMLAVSSLLLPALLGNHRFLMSLREYERLVIRQNRAVRALEAKFVSSEKERSLKLL